MLTMKSLQDYIYEKLNFKDKMEFALNKVFASVFRMSQPITTEQGIKNIKKFVERRSDGKVTIGIKRAKEIKRDLANCLNKDSVLFGSSTGRTIGECFETMEWGHDDNHLRKMDDNWQFIVYRKTDAADKTYVIDDESLYVIALKRVDGTRPIIAWIHDDWDEYVHDEKGTEGWSWPDRIVYEYIPMLTDFAAYKAKKDEIKKKNKENTMERIKKLEQELAELKNKVEND